MTPPATAVVVLFRTPDVDVSWIPDEAELVVVHNDDSEPAFDRPAVHLRGQGNVGFGGGVNLALDHVTTDRVVVWNPDMELFRVHWDALATGSPNEIITVPVRDRTGSPTSMVNHHYTPPALVASALRLGRLAPRGSGSRRMLSRLLGGWGRGHTGAMAGDEEDAEYPICDWWVSGAVFSISTDHLRSVEGFDTRYFLYFEDADLCRRLCEVHPDLSIRIAAVEAAIHAVGGSATSRTAQAAARRARARSAVRYATQRRGLSWRAAEAVARVVARIA